MAARPLVAENSQDHRALFPRLARRLVPNAPPQVDHPLAVAMHAAGGSELVPAREVLGESLPHGLEALGRIP